MNPIQNLLTKEVVDHPNYLRMRRHRFDKTVVKKVRVEVTATNGLNHARILGVRCYD